jgi:uncharacterized membrane protein YbhN (UPF0104 family)
MAIALFPTSPADEPEMRAILPLDRPVVAGAPSRLRRAASMVGRHRALALIGIELVVLVAAASLVGSRIPGLVSSIGKYLDQLRHPSPVALCVAVAAEAVSLFAVAMIPRLLVGAHGVRFRRRDAIAVGLTANGLAVVLPGGSVPSSVWLAHQLTRRGARATLAAWSVLASGFASSVTLILILLVGAGVASVISPFLTVLLVLVVLIGSMSFLSLVHRVDTLAAWSAGREGDSMVSRVVARFVGMAAEAAQWRAGWRTGGAVLFAAAVNWIGDAACLVAVFGVVDSSVPWRSVLVAYAAGQLLGAVVPLPGGLGAVEGGLVGTLVALGSPAGPVILVVAIYRLLGYWLPALAALPAYGWARREIAAVTDSLETGSGLNDAVVTETLPPVLAGSMAAVEMAAVEMAAVEMAAVTGSFGVPAVKRPAPDGLAAWAFARAMAGPTAPPAGELATDARAGGIELIGVGAGETVMCRSW